MRLKDPDNILDNDECSAKFADAPTKPVRVTTRPLSIDVPKLNEPARFLKNEYFSERFDDEPREPVKALASPLNSDPARLMEPERNRERAE